MVSLTLTTEKAFFFSSIGKHILKIKDYLKPYNHLTANLAVMFS
jgi:hypothetical protein